MEFRAEVEVVSVEADLVAAVLAGGGLGGGGGGGAFAWGGGWAGPGGAWRKRRVHGQSAERRPQPDSRLDLLHGQQLCSERVALLAEWPVQHQGLLRAEPLRFQPRWAP